MSSSTVRAQRSANITNERNVDRTNEMNWAIATQANEVNMQMMREQNLWNKGMWELENEYNSPAAQVQRYIEAGINPLWAIGNGDPGNAQQLTSASWPGAQTAQMQAAQVSPEYDPYIAQHVGNIVTAARDAVNGVQNFQKLVLDNRSLDIAQAGQLSGSALDYAKVAETQARTTAQQLENDWSLRTLDTRVHQEGKRLDMLYKQLDQLGADTAQSKAKKAEIEASTNLISEQINSVIAGIRQRDRELAIMEQNAHTNAMNAETNAYNAETSRKQFNLEDEKFSSQLKQWNNQNIMDYLKNFAEKHTNDAYIGAKLGGVGGSYEGHDESWDLPSLRRVQASGIELLQRAADNPSPQNLRDAEYAGKVLNQIDPYIRSYQGVPAPPNFNSTYQSIINPSVPWQQ